jgi:uncharacterized protein
LRGAASRAVTSIYSKFKFIIEIWTSKVQKSWIKRPRHQLIDRIRTALGRSRIVALLGPRQAGKTSLARIIAAEQGGILFDLEDPTDVNRLSAPMLALAKLTGLVVLDEFQLMPELAPILRVLADRDPLPARFLILGSASPDLLKTSSETLAGRVEFIEIGGFTLEEAGDACQTELWQRGGFPLSHLAADDVASYQWRVDFIRTFLERDIRRFGVNTPPEALRRIWQMLAHHHGGISNGSEIGRSLGESNQTIRRQLDILTNAFMIRQLPPWFENLGKRLVRHPKIYVRDTGLLHALLGLASPAAVEGHPKCGASWEGFCIEQILRLTADRQAWFWATHSGAELDLLILQNGRKVGFEFKYSDAPRTTKSMHSAVESLQLERLIVVHPGEACYPLTEKIQVQSLSVTLRELVVS